MANCLFSPQLLWCNQQDTYRSLSKAEYFPLRSFNVWLLCVILLKFILVHCFPYVTLSQFIDSLCPLKCHLLIILPVLVPYFWCLSPGATDQCCFYPHCGKYTRLPLIFPHKTKHRVILLQEQSDWNYWGEKKVFLVCLSVIKQASHALR